MNKKKYSIGNFINYVTESGIDNGMVTGYSNGNYLVKNNFNRIIAIKTDNAFDTVKEAWDKRHTEILTFEDAWKDVPNDWVRTDRHDQDTIEDLLWATVLELDLLTQRCTVHDELHHMTRKKAIRLCKEFLFKYKEYATEEDTKTSIVDYTI
ncbi:hypothetical protein [Clostridium tagluense]|uniref:Uncharacterized protein n=1 Tax=Clostridium tagluense TaxID=360422 RepID=A0A401USV5_9CLOT|nr:hypothetical protein [Clostridium tagluense]GCD12639.1 hypothetical protein Ctaglu_42620 [Clostridium tagluense]